MRIKNPIKRSLERAIGFKKEESQRKAAPAEIIQKPQEERQADKEIYDEFKKMLSKLPSIGGTILNLLAEKGINLPKMIVHITTTILREELRAFLRSIDVVGIMKRILLDTAVELRVEIAFRDKRQEEKSERKPPKKGIRIKKLKKH